MPKKTIRLVLVMLGGMLGILFAEPGENLLMNSALDSEQTDFPPFWYTETSQGTRYQRTGGPDGMGAVVMTGRANLRQQGMILVPGERYRLSGRFLTRNFRAKSFMFVVHNFAWQQDVGFRTITPTSDGWITLSQDLTLVRTSSATNMYGVALHMADATGELRATDLKLLPLSEKAKRESQNPMAHPVRKIIPLSPLLAKVPMDKPRVSFVVGEMGMGGKDYVCHMKAGGRDFTASVDKTGRLVVDFQGLSQGWHQVEARLRDRKNNREVARESFKLRLVRRPQISGNGHRSLNNLCREVLNAEVTDAGEFTFEMPRDGWAFIRTPKGAEAILDGKRALTTPEMLQELQAGTHRLTVRGRSGRVIVRSIAEIICYPVTAGGWPLVTKTVLGNVTTLNKSGERLTDQQLDVIERTGAKVIASCGVKPTKEAMLKAMNGNVGMTHPRLRGFISDECFFTSPLVLANYIRALLAFKPGDKTVYTWITGKPSTILHTDFMSVALNASGGRGRLLSEIYCYSHATEEQHRLYLKDMMVKTYCMFKSFHPESSNGTGIVLGVFSRPGYMTLNSIPDVDFRYALDMEMNVLANHPEYANVAALGYWGFNYVDEEMLRWCYALLRHYVLEGKMDMMSKAYGYTFTLPYLKNCDFESGLKHWQAEGSVSAGKADSTLRYRGGVQRRWGGTGDRFCLLKRGAESVAKVSQTARGLIPGRLYALHYVTADWKEVRSRKVVLRKHGIGVNLSGAEVLPGRHWLSVNAGNQRNTPGINHHKVLFRAKRPEVRFEFHNQAAKAGEETMLNFIQLAPYFPE